jgi:ribosomal protein S21|tara:strand:+ start:572 stop:763 length:192 start_codon:yes stop_codon:yes gene_type:complete
MKVKVRGTNIEGALRILKRKTKENNLINVLREKQTYEKPCQKRNRKKSAAKLRERRRQEPKGV